VEGAFGTLGEDDGADAGDGVAIDFEAPEDGGAARIRVEVGVVCGVVAGGAGIGFAD
jgi:hypothetical protein